MSKYCILIYTNENNIPIIELFLKKFFHYNPHYNGKIYVVSNNYLESDLPYSDKITYLYGNVLFNKYGSHFSQTMKNILPYIDEENIFFFCDDYFLLNPIDINKLNKLCDFISNEKIDLFSFAFNKLYLGTWERYIHNDNNFINDEFYVINKEWLHEFSVQPCIWTKSSLIKLIDENPLISLHDLDCSRIDNRLNYKTICTGYNIYDVFNPFYYIIGYIETIRHGFFYMNENGHNLPSTSFQEKYMINLIKEENLYDFPKYDKYFLKQKK